MLEYLNTVACSVLLVYCVPISNVISIRRRPSTALLFLLVVACFGLQVAYPFTGLIPPISWPAVVLNMITALGVTAWRKDAWAFLRAHLGVQPVQIHPLRRLSDFQPRELTQAEAMQVQGRGRE